MSFFQSTNFVFDRNQSNQTKSDGGDLNILLFTYLAVQYIADLNNSRKQALELTYFKLSFLLILNILFIRLPISLEH